MKDAVALWSNVFGATAKGCAYSRNDWSEGGFFGRRWLMEW
jgi:hypothetical protein